VVGKTIFIEGEEGVKGEDDIIEDKNIIRFEVG